MIERPLARWALLALVMSAAYSQVPIYFSSQNAHFLHGIARGGLGYLADDWFLRTADPFPVISALAEFTYRYLGEVFFYLYYVPILGLYLVTLAGLAETTCPRLSSTARRVNLAILVVLNSSIFAYVCAKVFRFDLAQLYLVSIGGFQVLGRYFQPSTFMVLLLAAALLFLRGRRVPAVIVLAACVTLHFAYLLTAIGILLGFLILDRREGRPLRSSLVLLVIFGLLLLPTLAYVAWTFRPTSPASAGRAREILTMFRGPHHSLASRWMDGPAYAKLALIVLGLHVVRGTRVFWVMAAPFVLGVALTIAYLVTGSLVLSLLTPWRISVFLLPLAAAVVVSSAVGRVLPAQPQPASRYDAALRLGSLVALVAAGTAGLLFTSIEFRAWRAEPSVAVMRFVERTKERGQVYVVPWEMDRFRLATGAPIFVDMKAVPFKDVDVLEWYRRMRITGELYERGVSDCAWLAGLRAREGVTHVVLEPRERAMRCATLREGYWDGAWGVYEIEAAAPRGQG